jgi:hypothetical protein
MQSLWHWLIELAEVYARHAGRHGPNRLLPAEVLPVLGRVPGPREPSSQGSGPDERTAEHSTPEACTRTRLDMEEEHAMVHEARHGSGHNRHGAVDRDQLRADGGPVEGEGPGVTDSE